MILFLNIYLTSLVSQSLIFNYKIVKRLGTRSYVCVYVYMGTSILLMKR